MADSPTEYSDSRFHRDLRLVTWCPRGVLDDAMADKILAYIEAREQSAEQPFARFIDLSKLDEIRLSFGHIFEIASRRRAASEGRPPVKSALYSNTIVGFGISRMYETLMEGSTIQVRAFRDVAMAAEWLGMPLEVLRAGD